MSIRTKILAAVVGLQLLVIFTGVSMLMWGMPETTAVPADILSVLSRIQADPATQPTVRPKGIRDLRAMEGVRTVVWLEESDDVYATPRPRPTALDERS